jgi:hypothetical protein
MSKVLVIVTTDHIDSDEAIRSVANGMKRAGYEMTDYDTDTFEVHSTTKRYTLLSSTDGLVEVSEPEVLNGNS